MTPISIIIPTRNRCVLLRRALQSVIQQDFPRKDFEVLVVDNASTDDTRSMVDEVIQAQSGHTIRYLYEPIPGLLSGRHRGAAESQNPILVFVDDDIEADRNWLAAIHDGFQDPEVHLVGGRSLPNYEVPPPSWISQIWERGSDYAYCITHSLLDLGDQCRQIDANYVWGLNFAIRRETLYRLGGFHPDAVPESHLRYRGDGETGLTMKSREQKLKAIYEPRAQVRHLVPAERMTVEYLEKRQYLQGISQSYSSIRMHRKFAFIKFSPLTPKTEGEMRAYRMTMALMSGYNFHQSEVAKDARLLDWVVRDNYFDYRYEK